MLRSNVFPRGCRSEGASAGGWRVPSEVRTDVLPCFLCGIDIGEVVEDVMILGLTARPEGLAFDGVREGAAEVNTVIKGVTTTGKDRPEASRAARALIGEIDIVPRAPGGTAAVALPTVNTGEATIVEVEYADRVWVFLACMAAIAGPLTGLVKRQLDDDATGRREGSVFSSTDSDLARRIGRFTAGRDGNGSMERSLRVCGLGMDGETPACVNVLIEDGDCEDEIASVEGMFMSTDFDLQGWLRVLGIRPGVLWVADA